MNAVGRGSVLSLPALSDVRQEVLESSSRIGLLQIHQQRIRFRRSAIQHDIRTRYKVEFRLRPVDAVVGFGQTEMLDVPTHVPHAKRLPLWVVPDSAAVRTGCGKTTGCLTHLPGFVIGQHWIRRMINRLVELSCQVGFFDERTVHEQLTSDINRNNIRRLLAIRRSR